jgi:hypothetical protein
MSSVEPSNGDEIELLVVPDLLEGDLGYPGLAQASVQPTFQATTEASQTFFQAVQSNNEEAIAKILGGSTELTSSRDPGQDRVDRELFVQKYQEMHRFGRDADGSVRLYIGVENWPFPVPWLRQTAPGASIRT